MSKLFDHMRSPIASTTQLRNAGVHPREILDALESEQLYRPIPGVVVTPEVYADPDLELALASSVSGGVIGLLSAAVHHDLCDASPSTVTLIVPAEKAHAPRGIPVSTLRTRHKVALSVGVEERDFHGLKWRVTDPARTVVDLYRITPDAWRQHAVAALATFLRDDGDRRRLHEYAVEFDVWTRLQPEVEAITETHNRGMHL
jgi:Predicted transcriptional regulator